MQKLSFVTTPIFYVNAAPHIGHLYTAVLTDALHRWDVLRGNTAGIFSTGTDEHGLKVQRAAEGTGITPSNYCQKMSTTFKNLFDAAKIGYTDYIRTTEQRHLKAVNHFWRRLANGGHIYRGKYEGWYSMTEEVFVTEDEAAALKDTGQSVEWSSEDNYIFRLTSFKQDLLQWIRQDPSPVYPTLARNQVESWIEDHLSDLSVSRPRSRLYWGIPVPDDQTQTIYVWLDALVNYLTVGGYPSTGHVWPATAHVVGKDILRFHAVFWPAFLMAAGLDPPERVISHSHWTMGKLKMSKSRGNVVDPCAVLSTYGVDPVRYFLLKDGRLHQDGDFSEERIATLLDSELADTLGNLLLRITSRGLYPNGPLSQKRHQIPQGTIDKVINEHNRLFQDLCSLPERVAVCYDKCEFGKGIATIMDCLHQNDSFIDHHKPWILVKNKEQHDLLQLVLLLSLECLRLSAIYLWPIIPSSSERILSRLGLQFPVSTADLHCRLRDGFSSLLSLFNIDFSSKDVLFKKSH